MDMEFAQFMHFGVNTFWNASDAYLHGDNPTFHNCYWGVDPAGPDSQTGNYYPCLDPKIFNPTDLDCDDWMRAASALGTKEICLTAQHEGGFALWPSNYTNYSVAASPWKNGKGDVLREFADAANRWGIKICYYLQAADDGWGMYHRVPKYTAATFLETTLGKLREVLTEYGPVNRFWFDGDGFGGTTNSSTTRNMPAEFNANDTLLWEPVFKLIRDISPQTLLGPKRARTPRLVSCRSCFVCVSFSVNQVQWIRSARKFTACMLHNHCRETTARAMVEDTHSMSTTTYQGRAMAPTRTTVPSQMHQDSTSRRWSRTV